MLIRDLLERIAKDPQVFILQQGWASVSLDGERGLKELRSLYEHLQVRQPLFTRSPNRSLAPHAQQP